MIKIPRTQAKVQKIHVIYSGKNQKEYHHVAQHQPIFPLEKMAVGVDKKINIRHIRIPTN